MEQKHHGERGLAEDAPEKTKYSNQYTGFPGGSASKESTCNAGDPGVSAGSRRFSAEGNGYPLQYHSLVFQYTFLV